MNITTKIRMSEFEKLHTQYSATKDSKQYTRYRILRNAPKYFYIASK